MLSCMRSTVAGEVGDNFGVSKHTPLFIAGHLLIQARFLIRYRHLSQVVDYTALYCICICIFIITPIYNHNHQ